MLDQTNKQSICDKLKNNLRRNMVVSIWKTIDRLTSPLYYKSDHKKSEDIDKSIEYIIDNNAF